VSGTSRGSHLERLAADWAQRPGGVPVPGVVSVVPVVPGEVPVPVPVVGAGTWYVPVESVEDPGARYVPVVPDPPVPVVPVPGLALVPGEAVLPIPVVLPVPLVPVPMSVVPVVPVPVVPIPVVPVVP